jgi:hypothetical protein
MGLNYVQEVVPPAHSDCGWPTRFSHDVLAVNQLPVMGVLGPPKIISAHSGKLVKTKSEARNVVTSSCT